MKYVFGPVHSRRFGISLGIDLSKDIKQCNFDCLYCELDGAKSIKEQSVSSNYKDILDEIKISLSKYENIDVITLTANGEPSMYPFLDELIDGINLIKGNIKSLILSNGVGVLSRKTRKIFLKIDIVKLSLDAVSPLIFKKINRAYKDIDIENIINDMIDFRKSYNNQLILEILFVKNVNDSMEELKKLELTVKKINPNRLDISTIDRPPAYKVSGVNDEFLELAKSHFDGIATTIARKKTTNISFDYSKKDILNLIKRRPQSGLDVDTLFSKSSKQNINELFNDGEISKRNVAGSLFYV